jgi:shikimate kinase
MTITLVGYRGTGKSTIAAALAARLGWTGVDADAEIESRAGRSIREIFDAEGEAGFRRQERSVLAELLRRDRLVVASGGGAVLDADTRRDMIAAGPVVWLTASLETLLARLAGDATTSSRRPALTAHDVRTEMATLLSLREPHYREVATLTVATDGRTPDEIVAGILTALHAPVPEEPA